jgi:hypothetical protein
MDFRMFHLGLPCPTLLTAVSGVAHSQGGRPAVVFYPLGRPTLYAYGYQVSIATHDPKPEHMGVRCEDIVRKQYY